MGFSFQTISISYNIYVNFITEEIWILKYPPDFFETWHASLNGAELTLDTGAVATKVCIAPCHHASICQNCRPQLCASWHKNKGVSSYLKWFYSLKILPTSISLHTHIYTNIHMKGNLRIWSQNWMMWGNLSQFGVKLPWFQPQFFPLKKHPLISLLDSFVFHGKVWLNSYNSPSISAEISEKRWLYGGCLNVFFRCVLIQLLGAQTTTICASPVQHGATMNISGWANPLNDDIKGI